MYSSNLSNCFLALSMLMHCEQPSSTHLYSAGLTSADLTESHAVEKSKLTVPVWSTKIFYNLFLHRPLEINLAF